MKTPPENSWPDLLKPIETEAEYDYALKRVYHLMDVVTDKNSPDGRELGVLAILVEDYEALHYPLPDFATPQQAMQLEMQERNLKQADLVPYFGSKSRVSEFLAGKRELTLPTIRKLHKELGIPLHILVGV